MEEKTTIQLAWVGLIFLVIAYGWFCVSGARVPWLENIVVGLL